MLKEQLLGLALKTLSEISHTKERIKNSVPGQLAHIYFKNLTRKARTKTSTKNHKEVVIKKERKSSIRPAKDIHSTRALMILEKIQHSHVRFLTENDEIDGKKSLAYLVWALGQAEQAGINEGISVHDVSSLLYQACRIELYPINVSRAVYGNANLVTQGSQKKRTKTYVLTPDGKALFKNKFLL